MEFVIRKPQARDLFVVGKILRVIGFKNIVHTLKDDKDIQNAKKGINPDNLSDDKANAVGLLIVASLADSILENLDKIEPDLYQFISNLTDLQTQDIAQMNIVDFAELVMNIFKMPDFVDFIKVVLKSSK